MTKGRKLKTILAGLSLTAMTAGSAVAQSDDGYLYEYRYFSDSTLTEQVGYQYDGCNSPGYLDGEQTAYYIRNIVGYREGAQCIYI